ncbi:MAG TPA: adenylate/guanylate cyclase domain-containing protein [Verrucomicrobiae bacterium]|nr:adenylate/guanylate cyclase domain-containing protein [Verrucomicrobiae bacterium]
MTQKGGTTESPVGANAAVLFGDVAGSTALYQAVGNERAQALIERTLGLLRDATTRENGRVVKTIGDEVMCRFADAAAAARAAMDMQRKLRMVPAEPGANLKVRIGFAYGTTVERDGDVFGDVVNIAARLAAMAKADQILTTEDTSRHFDRELKAVSRLFDKTPVKGIKEEVSVVQIVWEQRNQTILVSTGPTETVMAQTLLLKCKEQQWTLTPADLPRWMGRSEECEMVLQTSFASRKHVRFEYRRGKFMLVDESSNGTYVALGSGKPIYVRNEAFALVGAGTFSLGTRPEGDEFVVSFATG